MSSYGNPPQDPNQPPSYGEQPTSPYTQQPAQGGGGYGYDGGTAPGGMGPMPSGKGFFGALFDFSFNHFITPMVVKVVYILGMIAMVLGFLIWLVVAFASGEPALGIAVLVFGPIGLLLYLCLFRMTLEFYVAIVRMSEDINHRLPRA